MAHTTIWMPLFSEYCLLRSTTGNVFKFVRMFTPIDQFLAKNKYFFFNLLINPMKLNPSSETHSADHAVSHLLETWLYFFAPPPSQGLITGSHFEQSESVHTVQPYSFKISSERDSVSTLRSFKLYLVFRFLGQQLYWFLSFILSLVFHHYSNIWFAIHIMKLVTLWFFPYACYFILILNILFNWRLSAQYANSGCAMP